MREVKDLSATRLREGDAILAAVRGSTKDPLAIFSNLGSCYVMRVNDVPFAAFKRQWATLATSAA